MGEKGNLLSLPARREGGVTQLPLKGEVARVFVTFWRGKEKGKSFPSILYLL